MTGFFFPNFLYFYYASFLLLFIFFVFCFFFFKHSKPSFFLFFRHSGLGHHVGPLPRAPRAAFFTVRAASRGFPFTKTPFSHHTHHTCTESCCRIPSVEARWQRPTRAERTVLKTWRASELE